MSTSTTKRQEFNREVIEVAEEENAKAEAAGREIPLTDPSQEDYYDFEQDLSCWEWVKPLSAASRSVWFRSMHRVTSSITRQREYMTSKTNNIWSERWAKQYECGS
jgi:hypothetical protein